MNLGHWQHQRICLQTLNDAVQIEILESCCTVDWAGLAGAPEASSGQGLSIGPARITSCDRGREAADGRSCPLVATDAPPRATCVWGSCFLD
jgi:hypothetical protein